MEYESVEGRAWPRLWLGMSSSSPARTPTSARPLPAHQRARGTMLMIRHAAPHMVTGGGGSIINNSTGISLTGDIFTPSYSSSETAVNAPTRNAAVQFGCFNIRCNAISPGLVLSPLVREMMAARADRHDPTARIAAALQAPGRYSQHRRVPRVRCGEFHRWSDHFNRRRGSSITRPIPPTE